MNGEIGMEKLLKEMAWHQTIAKLIESINQPSFWSLLTHTISDYVHIDNWVCLLFQPGDPPQVLAESTPRSEQEDRLFRDYLRSFYQHDPFYVASNRRISSGLIRLDDLISEQFDDSDYYQRYFRLNIIGDEVQYNQPLAGGTTLCLSLGSHHRFQPQDMAILTMIQPWVIALIELRYQCEQQTGISELAEHDGITAGYTMTPNWELLPLTGREQEVCQLMLEGLAVKQIAYQMAISVETVRAHKKHIYSKLGINSQSQLFSLCWQPAEDTHQSHAFASRQSIKNVHESPMALATE
jgi:DNA-binding CsgD family transcriptional regulator